MPSLEEATPARGGGGGGGSGAGGFRGRGRGRGRGNSNGRGRRGRDGAAIPGQGQDRATNPQPREGPAVSARAQVLKQQTQAAAAAAAAADDADGNGEDDDAEICFICANPVAHHSVAPCNHATCHICGLRMRALYKTTDCAHCRTPAPWVIFTDNTSKRFEEYTDGEITTIDSNIGIKYTNEDIVGDTVLLLRYNCPDDSCDFAGLGWPDLHRHVKQVHRKRMCDVCTRNKKVFTHEHELFSEKELEKHMRRGDDKPGAADQTGFKGHPLCGFCGERFYDGDKLYEHCRMKHERCFICDRQDARQPHYYRNYDALEQHFKRDHYLCSNSECMEKKFVVFESEMDLQAHNLSEHAGRTVGRDARLVDMSSFDLRQSYQTERRAQRDGGGGGEGGGRNRRGGGAGGGGGGRGRDPNVDVVAPTSAQPLRRDELALQRQLAIHSAQSVSNRSFGGQLSTPLATGGPAVRDSISSSRNANQTGRDAPTEAMESLNTTTTGTDTSNLSPEERARLVRHSSVIERAANLVGNDGDKMRTFRQQISTYRQGDMTAPQLVDAFFTLFADVSPNTLGILVREVADLFEDKIKADGVRQAWQDWRAINEDYPSLPGIGGMHGATSSSSGWANAATASPAVPNASPAQKHSHRVLRLKTSTRLGGGPSVAPSGSSSSSGGVKSLPSRTLSSVAQQQQRVSASPAAFPSLPSASTSASASASAASSSSSSRPNWGESSSQAASQPLSGLAARGQDAFPALPAAPKPSTTIWGYGSGRGVRRDYGQAESSFQWGGQGASAGPASAAAHADPGADEVKGKKGKKGKKVLVQWG